MESTARFRARSEDNWVWSPQGVIDMHRPESWGIVQFSTAAPGSVSFHPDPTGPIRDRLIEVYHAQKRFHEKFKRWAGRTSELDLPAWPTSSPEPAVTIQPTPDGFQAGITVTPEAGIRQTWTIRQDSRIAHTP